MIQQVETPVETTINYSIFKMKNENIKPGLDSDNIGSNAAMQLKMFYQSQILYLLNYLFLVAQTFVNF